ncbi:MAG: CoA transferase, partial [Dehalococcoidia bacterium]
MSGPLAGTRGIVLTQAWAGAYCTSLLAMLGADVVQVEVRKRPDSWRGDYATPLPPALADVETAEHPWNCNPLYNSVNLGKR